MPSDGNLQTKRGAKVRPIAIITADYEASHQDPCSRFSIFGDYIKEQDRDSVETDSDPPECRDICSNKGLADICFVTGGVIALLGTLSAISGIFPKNQAQTRLFLECIGCSMMIFGVLVVFLSVKLRENGKFHKTHLAEKLISTLDRHSIPERSHTSEDEKDNREILVNRKQNLWSSSSSENSCTSRPSSSLSTARFTNGNYLAPPIDITNTGIVVEKNPHETSLKTLLDGPSQYGESVEHNSSTDHLNNVPGEKTLELNCDNLSRQTQSTLDMARSSNNCSFDIQEIATCSSETGRRDDNHHSEESSGICCILNEAFGAIVSRNNDDNKFRLATMETALSTVVTVSTLVGCRHHSSSHSTSRNFCCLEHEIQNRLIHRGRQIRSDMRPKTMKRGFIMRLTQLDLVIVLLLLCLIVSDETEASRKFLTGLIIGTLLARNGVQQIAPYPVPQPSYAHNAPQHQQPLFIIIPSGGKKSAKPMIYPAYGSDAGHEPITYGAHRRSTAANKIVQQFSGRRGIKSKHLRSNMSKQVASRLLGAVPINSYLINNSFRDYDSSSGSDKRQSIRPAGLSSIGRSSDSLPRLIERYGVHHIDSEGMPIKRKTITGSNNSVSNNNDNTGLASDFDNAFGWIESINNNTTNNYNNSDYTTNGAQQIETNKSLNKDNNDALLELVRTRSSPSSMTSFANTLTESSITTTK